MLRIFAILMLLTSSVVAQEAPMTVERLSEIVLDIDPDAALTPNGLELTLEDIPLLIVVAPEADRMRAMVSIASAEDVTPEEMLRMMQANFDTALDARMPSRKGAFGACLFTRLRRWNVNNCYLVLPKR